jgi:hypothetical protein
VSDPGWTPPVVRHHLDELAGPLGIYQHARGTVPDPSFGTCTDDVARALTVDLLHGEVIGWQRVAPSAVGALRYLREAFDEDTGRFRNFRADDGTWADGIGSEDAHGRAMIALAEAAVGAPDEGLRRSSARLFLRACPAAAELRWPRPIASALIACSVLGRVATSQADPPKDRALELVPLSLGAFLGDRLADRFASAAADRSWPWPDYSVTYEAAILPRALLVASRRSGRTEMRELGLTVLDWLIDAQVDDDERFHPVGNRGWWVRGRAPVRFDQQPIEATTMILAAESAFDETGDVRYMSAAEAAFAWFLGRNDLGASLADPERGACRDGLSETFVNPNEGAESTLMWLLALERMRRLRERVAARDGTQSTRGALVRRSGRGQASVYART